jgi:biotin operon repressor
MASHPESVSDLAHLLKVIADETRLRILGSLAERPRTGKELAEELELTAPTISHHMRKLTDAGIVLSRSEAQRQWYYLNSDLLLASRRVPTSESTTAPPPVDGDDDADARFRAKVIRDFFENERLRDIPAQRKRRVIVLQHLMERFDPNASYREADVNALLRSAHEDVATLRRELVDYGFMQRDRGIYQVSRAGPIRSRQVAQEITGTEQPWLQSLLARVTSTQSQSEISDKDSTA